MHTSKGSLSVRLDYEGNISGGTQALKDLRVGARAEDHPMAHQTLLRLWTNRIPEDQSFRTSAKLTTLLQPNLNLWHDVAQLDVPKDSIAVGKSWKVTKRPVTLDYLFGFDAEQSCELSCEYLGSYQEGNRLIGVVRVLGSLSEGSTPKVSYGKFSGLALIDGQNRQLLDLMLRCDARKRTTGPNALGNYVTIDGVMQLRLKRSS
jgi:hypothetical protein